MSEDEQKISALTPEDEARLAAQRAVIEAYIGDEKSRANYQTPAGKLGLLRALLKAKAIGAEKTYELQSMGVILGDTFVQELGMQWVMVEDEFGGDPAIQVEGTSILLFPLTMISKRVESGEEVDVFDMFNYMADQIDQIRAAEQQ